MILSKNLSSQQFMQEFGKFKLSNAAGTILKEKAGRNGERERSSTGGKLRNSNNSVSRSINSIHLSNRNNEGSQSRRNNNNNH